MSITLPGLAKVVVWDEPDAPKKKLSLEEAVKWRGSLLPKEKPNKVELRKQCTLPPHTNIKIVIVLDNADDDDTPIHIDISMDKTASLTLLEASDFSIAMIEGIRMLKANTSHRKGELYGPDSNGSVRYE